MNHRTSYYDEHNRHWVVDHDPEHNPDDLADSGRHEAERCACGQYPDVCARHGHAEGHEPSRHAPIAAEQAVLLALTGQNLRIADDGRGIRLPDIGTAFTIIASLRAHGFVLIGGVG